MTGRAFILALRRYWRTFAIATWIPLIASVGWVVLRPMTYVSTTQLMVTIDGSATATAYQNEDVVTGRVNSYVPLLTSEVVDRRVIDALGLSESPGELAAKISASNVPPKTSLIDIAVADNSAPRAKQIADRLAREFITYTDALETPTGQDGQKVHTTVVSPASEPQARRAERAVLAVLAGFASVVIGLVAVWIRARTDRIVRTEDVAAAALGGPVIGTVNAVPDADGVEFEAYRRLRTRLRRLLTELPGADGPGRMWLLTSVGHEADTSVVAANLRRALESSGEPTTLIAPDPDQSLVPDALVERLREWRTDHTQVLVVAPPVSAAITASILSEYVDWTLVLVVRNRTGRRALARDAEDLQAVGARLAGVMLSVGDDG